MGGWGRGGGGGIPMKVEDKILGEILGMSRGMLNRKIEGHMKANSFKPPWAYLKVGAKLKNI